MIQKEKDKLSQEMSLMKKQVSGNIVNLATRNMHTKSVHIHFTYEHIHIPLVAIGNEFIHTSNCKIMNLIEQYGTSVLTAVVTFFFVLFFLPVTT